MIATRQCRLCGVVKIIEEYYCTSEGRSDSRCIECVKQAVRDIRERNHEYYLEYDRARANDPDRVAARKAYSSSNHGRAILSARKKDWADRNAEKRHAQIAAGNAIRDGRLIAESCEKCGDKQVDAHHDDYSKPLCVRWLCRSCHAAHHKAERALPLPTTLRRGSKRYSALMPS